MSSEPPRLIELLVDRATEGLDDNSERELRELLDERPDMDAGAFDRAASAVHLASISPSDRLPDALRETLQRDAVAYFDARKEAAPAGNVAWIGERPSPAPASTHWPWLATAAALLLAVAGWWPGTEPGAPTLAEQRTALIEQGAIVLDWTTTDDPSAVNATGDVVWSPDGQRGFMRFRGLQANEPSSFQYQLWIFDASRDDRFPVDGGVFDVGAGPEELIIPIRPSLPVDEAVVFAVTVEAPGGVVVSSRERIAVVAELG